MNFSPRQTLAALLFPLLLTGAARAAAQGDHLSLHNEFISRQLTFDGHVWRTTRFARGDGSDSLNVQSDEFSLLFFDNSQLSLDDYQAAADPVHKTTAAEERLSIDYLPRPGARLPPNAPTQITITYSLKHEPVTRKTITLHMKPGDAVDRLEVERFSTDLPQTRGGRGEPVFVNNQWFFGVEYPAAYSRRTDGNSPKAASGPYDKFGNYSFIDLDNRDLDAHPRPGLIRLFHFPGNAKKLDDASFGIISKTAVAGIAPTGESIELGFIDYLNTIRRPVRSFLHYNNWFDSDGKKLTPENFADRIYAAFKHHLDPYGVHIDAMVADDGWQNKKSIYQPNPAQFPNGLPDMVRLSNALEKQGTHLGLWLALNGYNSDIDWGKSHGYVEAVENPRFKRFHRVYALSGEKYNAAITNQLTLLIQQCHLAYIKHDFNQMCDLGDANGHPPTDRHGHEAEVDAELRLLALERSLNPEIYQNITNWIWFSPWWLQNGNNLWMLSSDSSEFVGLPEISELIRATAYRDVNLYQVWHDPATRPLVPISHLMTHGIIYTKSKYSHNTDTLRDFADYIMMYYMRGLQLKEWYINPLILSDDQWQVLARTTRWAQENVNTLANSVFVGGNPAQGKPYGYICWNADHAILSVRNPSPAPEEIVVPFDQTTWYRGPAGKNFHARMIYPSQQELAPTFPSGQPIHLQIPGFTVMVLQLEPGEGHPQPPAPAPPAVAPESPAGAVVTIPDEPMQRCDLMLISRPSQTEKKNGARPGRARGPGPGPPGGGGVAMWSCLPREWRRSRVMMLHAWAAAVRVGVAGVWSMVSCGRGAFFFSVWEGREMSMRSQR
ncbi:MAG: hypothetical protein ACTHN5_05615, partial [Phycisphaerae bacterium]